MHTNVQATCAIGPFGGAQGTSQVLSDTPKALWSITVYRTGDTTGSQINGIEFEYENTSGTRVTTKTWGTATGAKDKVSMSFMQHPCNRKSIMMF